MEPKIIKKNRRDDTWMFGQEREITLKAHWNSQVHATDNNSSIKEELKVIDLVFIQILLITPHQSLIDFIQKVTPKTSYLI